MAVGQDELPSLMPVPGLRLGTVSAGIETQGRKDLVLMEVAPGSHCAAVFTRNAFCAAPVTVAREHLQASAGRPRYLLVNTGNANAGTGADGIEAARDCSAAVAKVGGTPVQAEAGELAAMVGAITPREVPAPPSRAIMVARSTARPTGPEVPLSPSSACSAVEARRCGT